MPIPTSLVDATLLRPAGRLLGALARYAGPARLLRLSGLLAGLGLAPGALHANDDIFPASTAAAREQISWKDGYFSIKGQPTFIAAGEMHYARIPRELWRDRLWRVKQMGFNCIQMYVFWNSTETKDGVWDFTDNNDLEAWLNLIQELGMYAIVRVGPYSCAEWEHGGFPAWLTNKPGMVLRLEDPQFLRYVDRHLAKIHAIVARHQIHKGGNVIMVQLENEHKYGGWGTESKTPYLTHLYDQARAAGLEIPLFYSGLHHAADPSGEKPFPVGNSPWFSTEFWTGWIGKYGDMEPALLNEKIRGTWKIIAFGGAGYDYYVVHGGTNFGYSGDSLETTYDYSSPIGEAGQLRNLYGPARRAALFAQTFAGVLTASVNAPGFATLTGLGGRITTRQSPQGTIVFADNFLIPADKNKAAQHIDPTAGALKVEAGATGMADVTTRISVPGRGEFPQSGPLVLRPHDLRTVVFDLPWTASAHFDCIATGVLLRQPIGGLDTWVCYGAPGDTGEIRVKRTSTQNLPSQYAFTYPAADNVQEITVDSGDGSTARLLVMNTALADRTWFVKGRLVIGAAFVREDGSAELPTEGGKFLVYDATGKHTQSAGPVATAELPVLSGWQWRDAAQERQPNYNDSRWLSSIGAQPMESYDSFQNRYGWYRTTIQSDGKEPLNLRFMDTSGVAQTFLNGAPADLKNLKLVAGENTLALFCKISPRPKLFTFYGEIGHGASRGIWGPTIKGTQPDVTVTQWKIQKTKGELTGGDGFAQPDFNDKAWTPLSWDPAQKTEPLVKGTTWLRGEWTNPGSLTSAVAYLPQLEGKNLGKSIFVNGRPVTVVQNMFSSNKFNHGVELKGLKPGVNTLALKIISPNGGDASVTPKLELWACGEPLSWKFRGGMEGLEETAIVGRVTNWAEFLGQPWNPAAATAPSNSPVLWRTTFDYQPGPRETIGLTTTGLKSGHVWLNGHNLGESPQKVPLYMPECWLKPGANELVILDITGARPDQVNFKRYETRQVARLP